MFQLDDKFLADIGLDNLPEEEKKPFLQHIYEQLEYKVGIKLSDGMTDEQLTEFEAIIDRKDETVNAWLQQNVPDYHQDELFTRMAEQTQLDPNDISLRADYAATKWLEINRPDYRKVVAETLEELKQEIISNRDAILGS